MMTRYFSTVVSGLERVAEAALKRRLKDVQVELVSDGIIVYRTRHSPSEIQSLGFFSNSFVLFRFFRNLPSSPIQAMLEQSLADNSLGRIVANYAPNQSATFRVLFREDRLVAVDENLLLRFERKMSAVGRLRVNRGEPDFEYWFVARRQGFGLFGLRITYHRDFAKTLEKGELRPDLASLLCLLSEPSPRDRFIDPFAGSGSIPLSRTSLGAYRRVIASDNDATRVHRLKRRLSGLRCAIDVYQWDATELENLESGSVDKIVTDPPWGEYLGRELDLHRFYDAMLRSFARVLRAGGIAVILLARKDLFQDLLDDRHDCFTVENTYDILVSGAKAGVYKCRKTARSAGELGDFRWEN